MAAELEQPMFLEEITFGVVRILPDEVGASLANCRPRIGSVTRKTN